MIRLSTLHICAILFYTFVMKAFISLRCRGGRRRVPTAYKNIAI